MDPPDVTLEALLRVLPETEELEGLRLSAVRSAVPDPRLAWARSGTHATIDKRIVSEERLARAVEEAEAAALDFTRELFTRYRALFAAYYAGRSEEAVAELIALGEQKEGAGLFRGARQFFDAALALSLPLPRKDTQVLALRRIARVARSAGDLDEALQYYRRSAELASDSEDLRAHVAALTGTGYVLALQGKWDRAERVHLDALELLSGPEGSALRVERAQLYNNLGYFATRQGALDAAEEWLGRALELWGEVTSVADLGVCYNCLANLRAAQGRYAEARALYQRALDLPLPPAFQALISIDLAESLLSVGDTREAEEWGRRAEDEAIAARSPYVLGRVYQVLGNLARAAEREDGFIFYEKALEIADRKSLPVLEGETLVDYAGLRSQMGEWEEAESYLERAREIFARMGAAHECARVEAALAALPGRGLPAAGEETAR